MHIYNTIIQVVIDLELLEMIKVLLEVIVMVKIMIKLLIMEI